MAIVRVSDLILGTRRVEAAVDETLAPKAGDAALHARAAQLVSAPGPGRGGIEDPGPTWRPEKTYDSPAYPDEAHGFSPCTGSGASSITSCPTPR